MIEGCYANLARLAFRFKPRLIFLNPGLTQCIANCHARPWEPHKYRSKAQQDERLAYLLAWVAEYYSRGGEMSLSAHLALFAAYDGPKNELKSMQVLKPPSTELLSWTQDTLAGTGQPGASSDM